MLERARATENIEFLTPYVVEEFLPGEDGLLGIARAAQHRDRRGRASCRWPARSSRSGTSRSRRSCDGHRRRPTTSGYVVTEGKSTRTERPGRLRRRRPRRPHLPPGRHRRRLGLSGRAGRRVVPARQPRRAHARRARGHRRPRRGAVGARSARSRRGPRGLRRRREKPRSRRPRRSSSRADFKDGARSRGAPATARRRPRWRAPRSRRARPRRRGPDARRHPLDGLRHRGHGAGWRPRPVPGGTRAELGRQDGWTPPCPPRATTRTTTSSRSTRSRTALRRRHREVRALKGASPRTSPGPTSGIDRSVYRAPGSASALRRSRRSTSACRGCDVTARSS